MQLFNNTRTSGNFIQHKTDDGPLDYSADWDTFSFENELDTRKNILEEDLKAYNKLLNQPSADSSSDTCEIFINELQSKKELFDELFKTSADDFSRYNSLVEERKKTKESLEELNVKNAILLKTIQDLQEEETMSRKSYKQSKVALQKANEMYTTYFNIDVSTKNLSDTTYEASVYFKEKESIAPLTFTVDREEKTVLDFESNKILLPTEEEDIRKEFETLENIPGLFCAIHEIILKK